MTGTYDAALQMYREALPPVDRARLGFERWLAETGRAEHAAAGPPRGDLAPVAVALADLLAEGRRAAL